MANRTRVVVRTPGWILAGMLSLLAGLGPIAPASAQPTPSAGDARQRADELFRQGKEHFKEKKYAQTREAYQAAFDLKKSYDIACNLGNVEILLGKTRDGVEHLSFCIANFAATGDAALLEKAKKVIGDAKKQVAELTIRVNVKDAVVSVDGREIGRAPLAGAIFVEPGSRNVEAQLTGYEPARLVVGAGKGSAQTVEITLTASKVLPTPTPIMSSTPTAPAPLAGPSGIGESNRGAPAAAPPVLPPKDAPKSVPLIAAGFALGAVGFGMGIASTVAAAGERSDAESLRGKILAQEPGGCPASPAAGTPCGDLVDALSTNDTFSGMSVVGFAVGGAALVGTVVYLLLPSSAAPLPVTGSTGGGIRVAPVFDGSMGGLMIHRRF